MHELVWSAIGGQVERELEPRPETLRVSKVNNFGLETSGQIRNLGFRILEGSKVGNLVLVNTPLTLLEKEWKIYFQDKKVDPNLFAICLNHSEDIGYMDFLRQIRNQYGYVIFFP